MNSLAMKVISLILAFCVSACAPFPRDASGTTERIAQTGVMRVAIVTGTAETSSARRLSDGLARSYGAKVEWSQGPAALILKDLEEGKLDLVIGEFGRTSPTSKEASLSEAIDQPEPRDGKLPAMRFARKKGENRLIMDSDKMVMK